MDYTCSSDFTSLAVGTQQPATIDPTLDMYTRYPLQLGGLRQCGIRSLPDTSTHVKYWESNTKPSDIESNALSTWPHVLCCVVDARLSLLLPVHQRKKENTLHSTHNMTIAHTLSSCFMLRNNRGSLAKYKEVYSCKMFSMNCAIILEFIVSSCLPYW